jgi:hypothetical protein
MKALTSRKDRLEADNNELNLKQNSLLIDLKEKDAFKKYNLVHQKVSTLNLKIQDLENQLDRSKIVD